LEHAPRDPDDAAVLPDLDPELDGLLLGVPVGVLGKGEEHGGFRSRAGSDKRSLNVRNKERNAKIAPSLGLTSGDPIFRPMCGRVRLSSDVSEIKLVFPIPAHRPTPNFAPSWNAAPTDRLPIVRFDARVGERSLDLARWGLVP
jgi:hypothetical protein